GGTRGFEDVPGSGIAAVLHISRGEDNQRACSGPATTLDEAGENTTGEEVVCLIMGPQISKLEDIQQSRSPAIALVHLLQPRDRDAAQRELAVLQAEVGFEPGTEVSGAPFYKQGQHRNDHHIGMVTGAVLLEAQEHLIKAVARDAEIQDFGV